MSLTVVKGLQSEIFVPVTPPSVFTKPTKPMKEWVVGLATAAGVHRKDQERFNQACWRLHMEKDSKRHSNRHAYGITRWIR